jgi:short-subunit dehydrogenase
MKDLIKLILTTMIFCIPLHTFGTNKKKAIVIGASSGMGKETAKLLSQEGYTLGLCARRLNLLESLQTELPNSSYIKQIDVTNPNARQQLAELINQMGGLDLIIISISSYIDKVNNQSPNEWKQKERTLDVDAKGFISMADVALEYFKQQGHGHLVGISSTSMLRAPANNPVYSAAKVCISRYMEAQRNYMIQNNMDIQITDVVPGWVAVEHSPMGSAPGIYWEISTEEAGQTILAGIKAKKKIVYVPNKVWIVACILRWLPSWAYNKYLTWL